MVSKDNKELWNGIEKDEEEIEMVDFLSSEDIIDEYLLFSDIINGQEPEKFKEKTKSNNKLHY
ncbi:hypothetical protein U472_07115 [Orenia metallireducens]|jgi:inactivated superfamily I helicase|uniref:Uncharacterized protein n=1 Tax=Orenia metallireducens TaxID=1413210 RepID=A0A1C0AAE8_9FIRM|nr:hypothetical protein [Orenia metallireducens]OCL27233.1 hypothetical protein U472_07115 [Orenia metallireducens]